MRGIDHPEVADLAAVSAAVARLRDSKGSAGPHLRCVEAAAKYLGNALQNPTLGKVKAGPSRSISVVLAFSTNAVRSCSQARSWTSFSLRIGLAALFLACAKNITKRIQPTVIPLGRQKGRQTGA